MLKENIVTKTKDILIEYLRAFLKNPNNYISITNVDFSESQIYDKEPNELIKFPSILISAINGNFINSGIGDVTEEIEDELGNIIGIRYSGMLELPVTIEIATKTTRERDLMTDLISITLRVLLKRHLEQQGILIKDIRFAGDNEMQYDSDKIYISTISFTTWSEWYRDVSLLPLKGVNIDIDINKNKLYK